MLFQPHFQLVNSFLFCILFVANLNNFKISNKYSNP